MEGGQRGVEECTSDQDERKRTVVTISGKINCIVAARSGLIT